MSLIVDGNVDADEEVEKENSDNSSVSLGDRFFIPPVGRVRMTPV